MTRLIRELVAANKNIQFSETENCEEAMELFLVNKPEIIIVNVENRNGCEGNFLKEIKYFAINMKEINLSNHPFTKIILIDFSKAELQRRFIFG